MPLRMPQQEINGVLVDFPFTPYECQVDYMSKVLTCLQQNQNGVLESPTGTGKTLSLLCSSLAWLEGRKAQVDFNKKLGISEALTNSVNEQTVGINKLSGSLSKSSGSAWGSDEFLVPKIIYSSRTHSQLSQAVQELKKTAYKSVKTSVIGSREQLCIHPHVQKATSNAAKVQMCRRLVTNRQCHYYNNVDEFKTKSEPRKVFGTVIDIEDIVRVGQKARACPYYMARELKSDADIVFMPYNYLLDSKSRKAHGVELQGSVIIFDEAHNVEKMCEESASFDLSSLDIATAIEETTKLAEKLADLNGSEIDGGDTGDSAVVPEFDLGDLIRLKKTLMDIEGKVDDINLPSKDGTTLSGSFIFELLRGVNINWSNKNEVIDILEKLTAYLANDSGNVVLHTKGAGLSKFNDCLKIVFAQEPRDNMSLSSHESHLAQQFKVHIRTKEKEFQKGNKVATWSSSGNNKDERILSYWCFSPGHTMKDLLAHGVKVIILTSGTLSPLDSFAKEMEIPFPVQLENPHVIEKSQVWMGTVCRGPDSTLLNSDFKNRMNENYQSSLGNTIVNFARVVPNGMLVFFPSYPLMQKCVEKWQAGNQWARINQYKPVVVEPKGKTAFDEVMTEFYEKINDPTLSGAIFMAVCRGKVSEGLDFADINGRAVMITGLPYPPIFDPRVKLKMNFLNDNKKQKGLDGWSWYRLQATRAVNQAIGRVIRHKQDYGAIVLCDNRFSTSTSQNSLPVWVRNESKIYEQFGTAIRDAIKFFKEAEKAFPYVGDKPKSSQSKKEEITSGAYFELSLSRRSKDPRHANVSFQQASDVACHIKGLNGNTERNASLFSQYSIPGKGEQAIGRKRSLLEALESTEVEDSERCTTSDISLSTQNSTGSSSSQFEMPSYQPPIKKSSSKQKKIIIKPNSSSKNQGKLPFGLNKANATSTLHRPDVLDSCQKYVNEVKKALSQETYKTFSCALADYKLNRKIVHAVPILAGVFIDCPENHHLFQKFYRFVRNDDKPYFNKICQELTGLSCEEEKIPKASSSSSVSSSNSTSSKAASATTATKSTSCVFCKSSPPNNGMRHPCKAVACLGCWKSEVFDVDKDRICPECGDRVKRKQLQPVYLNQS